MKLGDYASIGTILGVPLALIAIIVAIVVPYQIYKLQKRDAANLPSVRPEPPKGVVQGKGDQHTNVEAERLLRVAEAAQLRALERRQYWVTGCVHLAVSAAAYLFVLRFTGHTLAEPQILFLLFGLFGLFNIWRGLR